MKRCRWTVLSAVALAGGNLAAQQTPASGATDPVLVVPGPHYGANWLQRWLLGGNYRDLWTHALTLERRDLAPAWGGPPLPRRPPALEVLRELAASRHPVGGLVVAALLEATGVPHLEPLLGIRPDSAEPGPLGRVRAGALSTVEPPPGHGFAGSDGVEDTEAIWARIQASPADRIDARAYLAARLVDLLVGDADRGPARWSWAGYPDGLGRIWRPVHRGGDGAFARLDGLVPSLARLYYPELVSFGPDYPDLVGLTWSARAMDRRLLVELSKAAWDSVARTVQGRLPDSVLAAAVERLPGEMDRRSGDALLAALRSRRDRLLDAVDRFYSLVTEYADVHATDGDEWAEVERLEQGVRVRIGPAAEPGAAYFDRAFPADETREIRLYLGGGNDRVVIRGSAPRSARVRVVGGSGADQMADSSLGGLPLVRSVLTKTYFYDDDESRLLAGPGTEIDRGGFREPASFRDWGSRRVPTPWITFQPNLGFLIGGGVERRGFGFREVPFASRQTLRAAFATGPGRFRVEYEGDFRNLPRRAWASLSFRYSGIDFLQFYGTGNETPNAAPVDYYRLVQRRVGAAASVTAVLPRSRISLGPFFAYAETETGRGGLIDSLRPYGVEGFVEAGVDARVEVDTRDRASAPRRGVRLVATGRVVPKGLDVVESYASLSGAASTYLSLGDPARVTLALRAGGKRVLGRYPFHAAAVLGGASTVRGYGEQRFAGDAAVYGNGELRLFLARVPVPLPADVGVLGLGDAGRVFVAGETSGRWHQAFGFGLWLAFIERGSTATLTAARSPERWAFYGALGFMF